jgi:hypothetical protein
MRNEIDQSVGRVAGDVGAGLTGVGILLMVLFPFAIPGLLLAAVLAAPLVLPVAVLAIAAALVAGSSRAIRWLARGPRKFLRPAEAPHEPPALALSKRRTVPRRRTLRSAGDRGTASVQ